MNSEQTLELLQFLNEVIDKQISRWKTKNICISADYSHLAHGDYVRISFIGNNEERLLLDINTQTGFFTVPQRQEECRDDFFLLGNKKMKCKRYTICCENNIQAQQVLTTFNTQYQTQFELD
ncbi:hypothetical protein ACWIUA_08700 [Ursidibacter sp. B-7004-1]